MHYNVFWPLDTTGTVAKFINIKIKKYMNKLTYVKLLRKEGCVEFIKK